MQPFCVVNVDGWPERDGLRTLKQKRTVRKWSVDNVACNTTAFSKNMERTVVDSQYIWLQSALFVSYNQYNRIQLLMFVANDDTNEREGYERWWQQRRWWFCASNLRSANYRVTLQRQDTGTAMISVVPFIKGYGRKNNAYWSGSLAVKSHAMYWYMIQQGVLMK